MNGTTTLLKSHMAQILVFVFIIITGWWITIKPFNHDLFNDEKHLWTASYVLISFLGSVFGLMISGYWGGYKSTLGRSILALSIGLLLQTFGQLVYNFYTLIQHIEAPYPSLGDLGYFGSIPAYIYGVVLLGHGAGLRFSLKSFKTKMLAVLLPTLMLGFSYYLYLLSYEFDRSSPLTVLLDFGYPLGQAIYVSVALLILLSSSKLLGGVMRKPILLLLIALLAQYIADFTFLYLAHQNAWYAGGIGDYLFAVSYTLMALALIYVGVSYNKISNLK